MLVIADGPSRGMQFDIIEKMMDQGIFVYRSDKSRKRHE
jgi:hypothetical protein